MPLINRTRMTSDLKRINAVRSSPSSVESFIGLLDESVGGGGSIASTTEILSGDGSGNAVASGISAANVVVKSSAATPTTLNEVIALLQAAGLCSLILIGAFLPAQSHAASFGDIPASLALPAGESVRRNAGNSAFEAFTATDFAFKTISVSGQSDVVADSAADTLTLAAGSNVTITTNASTDTVTIASSGGGTPGGSDTQVQFNDGGSFGGDSGLVYAKASDKLTVLGSIELGNASDTTLTRASAGQLDVEGVHVIMNGGALGTPSSGTLTNCTFPTLNQNTTGSAASLSISGQTGLLTFTGLSSTNRTKTVRDAADTILELGGSYTPTGTWTSMTLVTPALGTPASGTLTNCTGYTEANLSTSDITTNDVSTSKHGFAPKAPNDATKYLDGTGAYSYPGYDFSNVLSGDVTVTNAGLTDVSGWSFSANSGEAWEVTIAGADSANNTTGDITVSLTTTGTWDTSASFWVANNYQASGTIGTNTLTAFSTTTTSFGAAGGVINNGDGVVRSFYMKFNLVMSGNGNVKFQMGNNTPSAGRTSTIYAKAYMRAKRVK